MREQKKKSIDEEKGKNKEDFKILIRTYLFYFFRVIIGISLLFLGLTLLKIGSIIEILLIEVSYANLFPLFKLTLYFIGALLTLGGSGVLLDSLRMLLWKINSNYNK
jgi:hypothetical protein